VRTAVRSRCRPPPDAMTSKAGFQNPDQSFALGRSPVIRLHFVVQVPDASDKRVMAAFFCPIDRFLLRFEGAECVVRMVFDDIIVDRTTMRAALGPRFNINVRHGFLSAPKNPGGRNWVKIPTAEHSRREIISGLRGLPRCCARRGRSARLDIDCLGGLYGLGGLLDRQTQHALVEMSVDGAVFRLEWQGHRSVE